VIANASRTCVEDQPFLWAELHQQINCPATACRACAASRLAVGSCGRNQLVVLQHYRTCTHYSQVRLDVTLSRCMHSVHGTSVLPCTSHMRTHASEVPRWHRCTQEANQCCSTEWQNDWVGKGKVSLTSRKPQGNRPPGEDPDLPPTHPLGGSPVLSGK